MATKAASSAFDNFINKNPQQYIVRRNGVLEQFYFFNLAATMVETMSLNAVVNGKLISNFPFLRYDSVQEGNGRRRFVLPNGSEASFYTGGEAHFLLNIF